MLVFTQFSRFSRKFFSVKRMNRMFKFCKFSEYFMHFQLLSAHSYIHTETPSTLSNVPHLSYIIGITELSNHVQSFTHTNFSSCRFFYTFGCPLNHKDVPHLYIMSIIIKLLNPIHTYQTLSYFSNELFQLLQLLKLVMQFCIRPTTCSNHTHNVFRPHYYEIRCHHLQQSQVYFVTQNN